MPLARLFGADVADYLVRKGVPFRETHHISGSAVRLAEEKGLSGIDKLTTAELQALHPAFEEDVRAVFDFEASVERRTAIGGTSRACVEEQIATINKRLA